MTADNWHVVEPHRFYAARISSDIYRELAQGKGVRSTRARIRLDVAM